MKWAESRMVSSSALEAYMSLDDFNDVDPLSYGIDDLSWNTRHEGSSLPLHQRA